MLVGGSVAGVRTFSLSIVDWFMGSPSMVGAHRRKALKDQQSKV